MKICIVGAGAIGGLLGVRFALSGHDVTLVARQVHFEAIKKNGLKLIAPDGSEQIARNTRATPHLGDFGPQDAVMLAVKAHQIVSVAKELRPLLGPSAVIVTVQNGVPWWYFQKHGGEFNGHVIQSVDPGGALVTTIDVARVIGCVVYPAAEVIAPGVVRHIAGNRFALGELDGAETARIQALAEAFARAGFEASVTKSIRAEIWLKLWGNLAFNPISALTHATLVDIARFPPMRSFVAATMTEVQTIANRLGIQFRVSLEQRIAGAEAVGKHKTSMLQDVEAGRAFEVDALLGAVLELGKLTHTPTPRIDALYACASMLAKTLADQNGRLRIEPR